MDRTPTLRDVAAEAGVAVSTASRALSRPGRVSEATTARVIEAAERLGYPVGGAVRLLREGMTGTVALVVPDIANPYFFGIIRGIQARLRDGGYVHVLVDSEESVDAEERALRRLRARVDGVVLAAPRLEAQRLDVWSRSLPLVTINRQVGGAYVLVDTPGGALQALDHLVSLGHRRIAYAGGPRSSWSDRRRRSSLRQAVRRAGVDVVWLGPYAPRREAGPAAADAALSAGVTAVIAFNDLLAFGILDRLAARRVPVPDRMSVVGCDDIFGADLVRPALTTVAVPLERAGHHAADLLLASLEGRSPDPVLLPTHLVVRESSGRARG